MPEGVAVTGLDDLPGISGTTDPPPATVDQDVAHPGRLRACGLLLRHSA
ncbi:hypothetical protein ACIQJT_08475 [Streptomyces sp. NPDC091972]